MRGGCFEEDRGEGVGGGKRGKLGVERGGELEMSQLNVSIGGCDSENRVVELNSEVIQTWMSQVKTWGKSAGWKESLVWGCFVFGSRCLSQEKL